MSNWILVHLVECVEQVLDEQVLQVVAVCGGELPGHDLGLGGAVDAEQQQHQGDHRAAGARLVVRVLRRRDKLGDVVNSKALAENTHS